MRKTKHTVLVMGTVAILVGMGFAAIPVNTLANGIVTLPPSVSKGISDEDVYFGSVNTETTVTIKVTGNGGTSTTITPMDVVFAIDSSGSMDWNDEDDLRLIAAKTFVDLMDDSRDQGGVVSWDNNIDFTYGLTQDFDGTDELKDKIDDVDSVGGTNLDVGLAASIDMLDANSRTGDSVEAIIYLTDGYGTYTYSGGTDAPVDEADDSGYVIYSILLHDADWYVDPGPLQDMALTTEGAYYDSYSADNLEEIYEAIYDAIVTSTIPTLVDVIEVTESYIVGHNDFSITPDSISPAVDGTTTITWLNVAQHVGDFDDALDADETVTLSFDILVDKAGYQLEVQVEGEAIVEYSDSDGTYVDFVDIPQEYINGIFTANLIADGGDEYIDVGDVYMWQDEDYLYVKYVTTGDWEMTETHLHVTDGVIPIPQTKKGNPKIGKFEYSADHDPAVTEHTYTIDWTWGSGATLYIAAHAVVQMEVESLTECTEPEYRIETAWGEGTGFPGSSWAMYMVYVDP